MDKLFLQIGAIVLALAVILGAFAAHGLEAQLTNEQLETFNTGVRYQFYHGFGILITGVLLLLQPIKSLRLVAWLFLVGILLFSGSIYLLACKDLIGMQNWKWLGPITPLGGTLFIAGWVIFLFGVRQLKPFEQK